MSAQCGALRRTFEAFAGPTVSFDGLIVVIAAIAEPQAGARVILHSPATGHARFPVDTGYGSLCNRTHGAKSGQYHSGGESEKSCTHEELL